MDKQQQLDEVVSRLTTGVEVRPNVYRVVIVRPTALPDAIALLRALPNDLRMTFAARTYALHADYVPGFQTREAIHRLTGEPCDCQAHCAWTPESDLLVCGQCFTDCT